MRTLGLILFSALVIVGAAQETPDAARDLFDHFAKGWRVPWHEQKLFSKPTRYEAIVEGGRTVLHASSDGANAGLVRKLDLPNPVAAQLKWNWKIKSSLSANLQERTRSGDDYAARVCVVFESSLLPLRTRSLHYVWAAHEPVGTIYPSPYSRNVAMIVIRSGNAEAGQWHEEARNVLADYEKFFGAPPTQISAVALVVDTDNTELSAEAWFANLELTTTPAQRQL